MRSKATLVFTLYTALLCHAGFAAAQQCPEKVPDSSNERRAIARDFFGKADAAEKAGDDVNAIKAYQCSLRMVPHPNTAYNLAELAAKTGDLELAAESYGTYLKLKPDAHDKADVEEKVKKLEARIAEAREATQGTKAKPVETKPEPAEAVPGPDERRPGRASPTRSEVPPDESEGKGGGLRTAGWVVAASGALMAGVGLVMNLGARGDMDECRKYAKAGQLDAARGSCDSAKPKAYTSYALLGVGPAAIAAGLYMALALGGDDKETSVAVVPYDDGAAVSARWRF
jgi:tetratricopeptide (TPR) repeat protein